jgi:hypothetical protein
MMTGPASLRWLLTVAFAVATGFHLLRSTLSIIDDASVDTSDRVADLLHTLMTVGMIAMIWPWGGRFPREVQVALSLAGAAWFLRCAARTAAGADGAGRRHAGGRVEYVHFAIAMSAMAWQSLIMPAAVRSPLSHTSMREMSVSGSAATSAGSLPLYSVWVSAMLGAYFVVAAQWWIARAAGLNTMVAPSVPGGTPAQLDLAGPARRSFSSVVLAARPGSASHGITSMGMGILFLAML